MRGSAFHSMKASAFSKHSLPANRKAAAWASLSVEELSSLMAVVCGPAATPDAAPRLRSLFPRTATAPKSAQPCFMMRKDEQDSTEDVPAVLQRFAQK